MHQVIPCLKSWKRFHINVHVKNLQPRLMEEGLCWYFYWTVMCLSILVLWCWVYTYHMALTSSVSMKPMFVALMQTAFCGLLLLMISLLMISYFFQGLAPQVLVVVFIFSLDLPIDHIKYNFFYRSFGNMVVLLGLLAIHYGLPVSTTLHDRVPVTFKKNSCLLLVSYLLCLHIIFVVT